MIFSSALFGVAMLVLGFLAGCPVAGAAVDEAQGVRVTGWNIGISGGRDQRGHAPQLAGNTIPRLVHPHTASRRPHHRDWRPPARDFVLTPLTHVFIGFKTTGAEYDWSTPQPDERARGRGGFAYPWSSAPVL